MSTSVRLLALIRKGWLSFALLSLSFAPPQRSVSDTAVGFALSWEGGRCIGCKIAVHLGELQFTDAKVAWGIGYTFGPVGTGDYVVVHTEDGGRTWREVPDTYQHAGAPAFSFVSAREGWLALWNKADLPKMLRTVDGGKHWDTIGGQLAQKLQFLDGAQGYGAEGTTFLKTMDGGRTWRETAITGLGFIDRLFFLSSDVGWTAGTDGRDFLVFRTTDGGRTWEESRTPAPPAAANIADLFFVDQQRGWLITWCAGEGGTSLFATADGGRTWVREADASFQGPRRWARVVRFVSDRLGFVFETEEPEGCHDCSSMQRSADRGRDVLVYTADGGRHWGKTPLSHTVYDCQVFEGELRCSAGSGHPGFVLLTVRPK